MINVDILQRVKVVGLFTLQIYKVMTGTLLSLFVPQKCDDSICSLTENIEKTDNFHRGVLALNAITGVAFAVCYMIELKRENWAIKYLDIDNDQSDNSLKEKLKHYPKIEKEMDLVNYYYLLVTKITTIFYGINLIFSGILIKNNYYSSTTLSCYVSFSLLVILKLYNSLNVGYYSVKRDKILSAYMSEFVSFNVIDADFRKNNP
jgi:hypothetical protein